MARVPQVPDLLTQSGPNVALTGAKDTGVFKLESLNLDTTWRGARSTESGQVSLEAMKLY